MYVDRFATPDSLRAFTSRREAVLETARHYKVNERNAVVIGGGALALHGLDSSVEIPGGPCFDLDVIRVERLRRFIDPSWPSPSTRDFGWYISDNAPLEMTRIMRTSASVFVWKMGYENYGAMLDDRVVIDGLAAVPVASVARFKLDRGEVKDIAGLIKAHVVAEATGHQIVTEPFWQETVAASVRHCLDASEGEGTPPNFPGWLGELVQQDFQHPAFTCLDAK